MNLKIVFFGGLLVIALALCAGCVMADDLPPVEEPITGFE